MTLPGNRKLVCVGSYKLTGRRLGKGNFAKVEEAVHSVLKTKVALKVMNISEIKEDYVIRNLHREARLMSQLNHPCITTLFETMQNGNVYYLVTELVGGGDLCTFIKGQRGGRLEERATKMFGRQLVSAVAYMHGMGIVHRDLKMENIMLNDAKTQLKIVDFGLSNNWSTDNPLRTHCGSPEYAAPELFVTGQLYGPQVDLWSLGVILYGMVLGQLPFLTSRDSRISSQERRKHLLQQINRGLAPGHRKSLAAFSIEFRAMLARLLMPDPAKRIRILELVRHPWLTDRNRKPLRITGLNDLESSWKTSVLKEVCKLLHADPAQIVNALRSEPFGVVAGMYNILSFKRSQQLELAAKESITSQQPRRPATTTGTGSITSTHHAARFQSIQRPATAIPCPRPPAPAMTRTTAGAATTKKKEWSTDLHGTSSKLRVIGTRSITKPYSLRSSVKPSTQYAERAQKTASAKSTPETFINRRTKSEPLQQPLPLPKKLNTSAPAGKICERAAKRKSEQHQHQQQHRQSRTAPTGGARKSAPTATTTSRSGATRCPPSRPQSSSAGAAAAAAAGTAVYKQRTAPLQTSESRNLNSTAKRLLNEPIARCIAGYVGKYMNAHGDKMRTRTAMDQFRWIKDFATFNHPGATMAVETN